MRRRLRLVLFANKPEVNWCDLVFKTACGDIAKESGLVGRKVNHSGRKTTVTNLLHGNVPPTNIMQLTVNKNVNSISNYASASIGQQKEMSNLLTRSVTPATPQPAQPVVEISESTYDNSESEKPQQVVDIPLRLSQGGTLVPMTPQTMVYRSPEVFTQHNESSHQAQMAGLFTKSSFAYSTVNVNVHYHN